MELSSCRAYHYLALRGVSLRISYPISVYLTWAKSIEKSDIRVSVVIHQPGKFFRLITLSIIGFMLVYILTAVAFNKTLISGSTKSPLQMVPGLLIFFILFVLFFSYENYPAHFTETATAIRQVWSGSCRLSCRRASYISGYSEINNNSDQQSRSGSPPTCLCESCPCHIIENVLQRCAPFTEVYGNIVYALFTTLNDIFTSIIRFLSSILDILQCHNTCQRQTACGYPAQVPQLMSHPESSTKARSIMDIAKESLAKISVMASSKTSLTTTAGSSKGHSDRPPMRISSSETLTPDKKSKDCSKCVAKGKTCINECPRAKVENGLEAVNNTNNTMKIDIGIQFPEGILKRSCCLINEPCASGCPKRKGGQGPDSETKINRYLNWSEEISFPDEFKGFNRCISGKCVSGCSKSKGNQKPTTPQKDDDEVFDKKNVTPDETSMPNRDKCPRCGLKQCTSNCPRFQSENPPKKAAPIPSENAQEAANEIFTIYDQLDNQIISLDDIERISTTNEKDNEEPRLDEQEDENKTEIEPTPSENKSQQVDVEEIVRPDDDDPKLDNNICVTCVTRSQQCKKSCPNFYFDITMDVAPSRMIPSNGNEQFPNVSAPIDDIIKKCPKCSGRGACRSYCPNLTRKSDVVIKISSQVSMARDIHDVIDEINSMFDEPDYDTPQCLKCNSSFKMCTKSCPNINKQQHVTEDQDTAGPTPMSTIDINLSTNGGAMTLCTKCSRSRTTCSNDCPRHKQNKDV